MLETLEISNFVIIKSLNINFQSGFTVITGPSGSGKSLLFKAIEFCFGDRVVNTTDEPMVVALTFSLQDQGAAKKHTVKRELSPQGRSKYYIDNEPVKLASLQSLYKAHFSHNHQHQHYALLDMKHHAPYYDYFCKVNLTQLTKFYSEWQSNQSKWKQYQNTLYEFDIETLTHFTNELEEFFEGGVEYDALQADIHQLKKVQHLKSKSTALCHYLKEQKHIEAIKSELPDTITNTLLQYEDCRDGLVTAITAWMTELEESDLKSLIAREQQWHELSRKHQCHPLDLYTKFEKIQKDVEHFNATDPQVLQDALNQSKARFFEEAKQVSDLRLKHVDELNQVMTQWMWRLGMKNSRFEVEIRPKAPSQTGLDEIEFKVATNQGQDLQPLAKVSGGELSRIGLALEEVINLNPIQIQMLDEVDVGISGGVAEQVAKLLYQRAHHAQVLCITHLPQVAMYADQHIYITKHNQSSQTAFSCHYLDGDEKANALAELLSGEKINEEGLSHARAMLAQGKENQAITT